MTHDYLYFWDKLGIDGKRTLLGEIQTSFNMSFVIDGTKDSTKVQVFSFSISETIKPNTVVWHENTSTWWIVANDKVENRVNENGFMYIHNLQLEGAIELLNARDLTDCGFNQYTYTIDQFGRRLFALSNFELKGAAVQFIYGNNIDKDKVVDYLKSFENYSLLSALREFFDGYNCSLKMEFLQHSSTNHYIYQSGIYIVLKTGNIERPVKDFDTIFNDAKEIKTMNKNSYGTIVVSNADNIVSTKSKLYPSIGYVKLNGTENIISPNNACIRLPSNVSSVEYVDMIPGRMTVGIGRTRRNYTPDGDSYTPYQPQIWENHVDLTDIKSWGSAIEWIRNTLANQTEAAEWYNQTTDEFWNDLKSQRTLDIFTELYIVRLYNTTDYDPINDIYLNEHGVDKFAKNLGLPSPKPYVLGSDNLRNGVTNPESVMYWKKGSNLIEGFDFFAWASAATNKSIFSTTRNGQPLVSFTTHTTVPTSATYDFSIIFGSYSHNGETDGYIFATPQQYAFEYVYFKVKYIPMTDIKIKYDNSGYSKDTHIYNQNGKYTDGNALSTLICSYKNEIESDNITRYCIGYSFNDMPKVGDIVIKNNIRYVINNVSLTFETNEGTYNNGYFISGEYTLSKNVATKSLLVNPNTNIRDYSIPQKYNVKRKQLYRDFYEFDYVADYFADDEFYLEPNQLINATNYYKEHDAHTAVIKLTFDSAYGGGGGTYDGGTAPSSDTWFYQLETTTYFMKKSIYEVIDFQDNNIIGYSSQNVFCGFDIRRIFTGMTDVVNTPISYVDDQGKVKGIEIAMCNNDQLMTIWQNYQEEMETQYSYNYAGALYNYSVFIPSNVYNAAKANCDFEINEQSYNKDAIEVPVFEYCCQFDDSDNVIIGDNILEYEEDDLAYIYEYVFVPSGLLDNNNWTKYIDKKQIVYESFNSFILDDSSENHRKVAKLILGSTQNVVWWTFECYNSISVARSSNSVTYTTQNELKTLVDTIKNQTSYNGKLDLAIIKYTIKSDFTYETIDNVKYIQNVGCNLMMILKNAQNCPSQNVNVLNLYINHYKLN